MNITIETLQNDMEQFADRNGMQALIDIIYTICLEKRDHVATNWQDNELASKWNKAARSLDAIRINFPL